jgi:hypothetical protein
MVELRDLDRLQWKQPWRRIMPQGRAAYELELHTELCPTHPLYGVKVTAAARATNGDEVLFILHGHERPLAMVHLTMTGKLEANPQWPTLEYYEGLEEWVEKLMKPDMLEFAERLKKYTPKKISPQ